MYFHIVASWLQLIYTLWVFYVRILSICNNLIYYSISGGLIPLQILNWLQENNHKRVDPRGTKAHWVNPYLFFYWLQGNNIKRFGPRVTKSHWINPEKLLFTGSKAIFSIDSVQGEIRSIGLNPSNLFFAYKAIITRDLYQRSLRPIGLIPSIFN